MREITHRYRDPLDVVWTEAARRIGLTIERTHGAYASSDGRGTLSIGARATLDADDCLAQMVFHELCHSLVQGPESFQRVDWDLENVTDEDLVREHACLRLQAALAAPLGLRRILAPTTEHRAFYDALPPDPFRPADDEAVILARRGAARMSRPPWGPHLENALLATRRIAEAVESVRAGDDVLLWACLEDLVEPHPSGLEGALDDDVGRCETCAWLRRSGPGPKVDRCVQAEGTRIDPSLRGCARYESLPECTDCGACCREAYGAVEVGGRDRFVALHPELLLRRDDRYEVRRAGGRCAALEGGRARGEPYACAVYDDRPSTCREFERGSVNCLEARRRVGLSR
jgi:hypothetical protein